MVCRNNQQTLTYIRIIPLLSAAALRAKLGIFLGMWYCLRRINGSGSSFLDIEYTVYHLINTFGYSRSSAYRILDTGTGIFWSKPYQKGTRRPRLQIHSLKRVAGYLGTPCGKYFLNMPLSTFVGKKGHRVLNQKACLYASQHKAEGEEARPILRHSLHEITGIPIRTQQRYDKVAVKSTRNYEVILNADGKYSPILKPVEGKCQTWMIPRRLGNTYHCIAEKGAKGMLPKIRSACAGSCNKGEAYHKKQFFTTVKSYLKSTHSASDAMLLAPLANQRRRRCYWYRVAQ